MALRVCCFRSRPPRIDPTMQPIDAMLNLDLLTPEQHLQISA